MEWLLNHIPLVLTLVFVVISIVRSITQAGKASDEHEVTHDESEEQRRVREIQERIRRKIAERRGGIPPEAPAPPLLAPQAERLPAEQPRPVFRPAPSIPELDPFGGPLKRVFVELEKRVQLPPVALAVMEPNPGELERQTRLAADLKALEEARQLAQRRAAHAAETKDDLARSEAAMRAAGRGRLLEDLGDPQALRRAFVLREVLGTPVGLR